MFGFLFTVGQEAKFIAEGARRSELVASKFLSFPTCIGSWGSAKNIIQEGIDLGQRPPIGQNGKVAESIMAHPENKEKLAGQAVKKNGKNLVKICYLIYVLIF